MRTKIKIRGRLRIRDIPLCNSQLKPEDWLSIRHNLPLLRAEEKNVITDVGRSEIANILGGISDDHIDFMAIGDRGVNPSNINIPLAPSPLDVSLNNELDRKAIGTKNLSGQTLELATTFFTSDGPYNFAEPTEEVVNEFSLQTLSAGGVCVARKTFPSIPFGTGDRTGVILEWFVDIE